MLLLYFSRFFSRNSCLEEVNRSCKCIVLDQQIQITCNFASLLVFLFRQYKITIIVVLTIIIINVIMFIVILIDLIIAKEIQWTVMQDD